MKKILIFILLLLGGRVFSQELAKVDVLGCGSIDTIVVSSILKVTDPAVKSLLDSIVQGRRMADITKI